jgi:hypothetical protein
MRKLLLSGLTVTALSVLYALPANAQATRTWVSGVGDDANPCSRTAPCKTFAGAISKTLAGGEISVLDPGGFGAVTITKSIALVSDGGSGEASILASGTNGINIAGAGIEVHLRGIIVDGAPGTGLTGINFTNGSALDIQNSTIKNFRSGAGIGINFAPSTSAKLSIRDTTIVSNGVGSSGGGIVIKPTGGTSNVTLARVSLDNNSNGLVADASTTVGDVLVAVMDSSASSNASVGFSLKGGSSSLTTLALDHVLSNSNSVGVKADGGTANVLLSRSTIMGNTTGLSPVNSAGITSLLSNSFLRNVNNGAPTGTQTPQ